MFTEKCEQCGKEFSKSTASSLRQALVLHRLVSHRQRLNLEAKYRATCEVCGSVFYSVKAQRIANSTLSKHLKTQHAGAVPVAVAVPRSKDNKIRWTAEEVDKLARATAVVRLNQHDCDLLTCTREAVKVAFPPERQRHIQTLTTMAPNFREKVLVAIDAIRKEQIPPPVEVVQTLTVEVPVKVPVKVAPEVMARELGTPQLLVELCTRLFTRLDRLEAALAARPERNGHHPVAAPVPMAKAMPAAVEPRRRRIAIVGLFKDQFEHVRAKTVGADVDLVWVDKEAASPTYPSCDAVVVERHCKHRWFDAAQSKVGHSKVLFAEGISSVVQRVYDICSRQ